MDLLGWTHTLLACGALVLGTAVVLRPKGDRLHRTLGHLYVSSMLGVNGTALMIYDLLGGFGPFHWAAMASLATLAVGFLPVLARRPAGGWMALHGYWMSWSYVGLVAAAVSEIATRVLALPFWASVGGGAFAVVLVGGSVVHWKVPRILRRLGPAAQFHSAHSVME